ncbi:hypothetical protein J0895_18950 [Phormidium pseudopriestleyi FRX01]|uniref:Uncharacterized protein n=1 Tax=Phormidium pseudopriestleyi FRX01 TaxID=1759528 RepID=A0ABS3FVG7_9CYAN|nr:hypothetical protein [Phormidium pseudopriestleyi]MBO0351112.1 hypothetical protein [Phormidium pseudopriestleyi FRX01]
MRSPVGEVTVGLETSDGRSPYGVEIVGIENLKNAEGLRRSPCCHSVVNP